MEIPSTVFDYAPWSPSKASTALTCPHAFQQKHIEHVKPAKPTSDSGTVGTVVHRVLELAMADNLPTSVAMRRALKEKEFTYEVSQTVRTFRDAITDFLAGMKTFDQRIGIKEKHSERKLALDADFKLTPYQNPDGLIRGIIDLMIITNDHRGVVIDHKSGAPKPISMHREQLEAYTLFVDAQEPNLTSIRAALHYVGAAPNLAGKRTVWTPEYPVETVRAKFRQNLVDYLVAASASAATKEARKGWLCNFCGYQKDCPAYK